MHHGPRGLRCRCRATPHSKSSSTNAVLPPPPEPLTEALDVVPLDLGDLSAVSTAADALLAAHERIDLLVNNAGVMAMPQRTTVDGFEMQLGDWLVSLRRPCSNRDAM